MTKTPAQRQAEFYQRQLENGLKRVKVWVPVDKIDKLKALAKKLCGKA